jgi:hypothetical protein
VGFERFCLEFVPVFQKFVWPSFHLFNQKRNANHQKKETIPPKKYYKTEEIMPLTNRADEKILRTRKIFPK